MRVEYFLARRYLSSQRGRGLSVITWIALAGVIVGVMSLVTVLAVMSGFEKDLSGKILGNNAHIIVNAFQNDQPGRPSFRDLLKRIEKFPGVASVMPVIYGEAFALSPEGGSEGVFIKGVEPEKVKTVLDLDEYLVQKNWKDFNEGGVFLGESLARSLDVGPGDKITLLLNKADYSPLGVVPRMKKIKVVDSFHSGMTQYDSHHIYMPIGMAQDIFQRSPHQMEIRANEVSKILSLRRDLQMNFGEEAHFQDWLSVNEDFLAALRLEKTVMAIILALIVLVAAFNICGSLIMIVRDKTKDIAILKSMGAYDGLVLRIFFFQGMFIGLVGTIVGAFMGVFMSLVLRDWIKFPLNPQVYMIDRVPVDIRVADLIFVILGALAISAIATLYPAKLAASLNTTEGLKVE